MDKDFFRQICEPRLRSIMDGDDMLEEMLERMNNELDNADKSKMKKCEMLYYMNELAEEFETVLYILEGSIVEALLCGGTEEYDCDEFKMISCEPPEPFKQFSDVTEVTSPNDRIFYDIASVLSEKMNAFIREQQYETEIPSLICDEVEWIPDDRVSKSAIIYVSQY